MENLKIFFQLYIRPVQAMGELRGIGDSLPRKQNFKRFLHNATVNPKDADAHVQLGLLYLQR